MGWFLRAGWVGSLPRCSAVDSSTQLSNQHLQSIWMEDLFLLLQKVEALTAWSLKANGVKWRRSGGQSSSTLKPKSHCRHTWEDATDHGPVPTDLEGLGRSGLVWVWIPSHDSLASIWDMQEETEEGARRNHVGPLLSLLVPSSLRPDWTLTDWFDHQSVQTSCIFQPDLKETGNKFQSLKIRERWKIECLRMWEIRQLVPSNMKSRSVVRAEPGKDTE